MDGHSSDGQITPLELAGVSCFICLFVCQDKEAMALGSAPIISVPPIYRLQPPPGLHFLNSKVDTWRGHAQAQPLAMCKSNKLKVCCSQLKIEESSTDETCELVNGTELTIGDEAEGIRAYLFSAVKNNNATGVLLLSDIFGFEDDSTRDFAYRVACSGYNVLVPDIFKGDPWTKDRPMVFFEEWITKHNPERVAKDVFTSAKWMINEFSAVGISNKLGIIGFCFGGGRVVDILAQDKGACFGSGVSFYGTRIDPSAASSIKVPLLLISGDNDSLCPISNLETMANRNKEFLKMVVFRGRGHGFAHRPQTPEEDAEAEKAFISMRNWLHDALLVQS